MESEETTQQADSTSMNTSTGEQKITITYETLFDILRMEKRREDLQQLQPSFFDDTVHYLKQKKELIQKREHESGIDSFDEIKKLTIQYENIQKIIKEIYERREKKILMMALNKSRIKTSGMNIEVLLPQEMEFYEQLTRLLDTYRVDVMEKLIRGLTPKQQIAAVVSSLAAPSSIIHEQQQPQQAIPQKEAAQKLAPDNTKTEDALLQIKFLQEMEEFVGPELETYGPFDANTIAMIPSVIATVFISSGVAEHVKN